MITIYTDGSSRGNPGPGGWAAILSDEHKVVELGGKEPRTTNNRMELVACIRAMQFAETNFPRGKIVLYTDSEYVMKGITLWIRKWREKGWKTSAKKSVLNQDLWVLLSTATEVKDIEWKYVAGHAGHVLNERCDDIATSFADGLEPDLYNGPRNTYGHI